VSEEPEPRQFGPEGDTETLVRRVVALIQGTRTLPLSSSVKLDNKEEVLELLDEALRRLPEEVKQGRWMLKERSEYLARTERQGEEIVEAARLRAGRMVQRTEIVREARHTARRVVEEAKDEARRLRLEADDYCDQKLANFEIVLERTAKTVAAGRQKLATVGGLGEAPAGANAADETVAGSDAFFDQDRG
jgi:cell division septum initiation protein DivIVA